MQEHLTTLRKSQQKALTFFATALVKAESVGQTKIARAVPLSSVSSPGRGCKADSVERRFQRFLANERIDSGEVQTQLTQWILSSVPGADQDDAPFVLLIDETCLQEHVRVMALCFAWQGRALPLAWQCYLPRTERSQLEIITVLLQRVKQGLPQGRTVVVQADRGIGNSPALLKTIAEMGWFYLVRVPKNVRVRFPKVEQEGSQVEQEGLSAELDDPQAESEEAVPILSFSDLLVKPGDSFALQWGQAFKKSGWLDCGILGCFDSGNKDGWCLLTNYPGASSKGYALRMWVEACFKDFKSGAWQWHLSRVRLPARVERLWLVMTLASLFSFSLGSQAEIEPKLRREVTRGTVRRHSYLSWGIRLFAAVMNRRVPWRWVIWQRLVLLPQLTDNPFKTEPLLNPASPGKTVVQ